MRTIILSVVLFSVVVLAQSPYQETYEKMFFRGKYPQKVPVLLRTYPVYLSTNQFRVYLPVEISFGFLQFVYENDHYNAGAELEVVFTNRASGQSKSRIWQTFATVTDFDETNDTQRMHFTIDSLDLSPAVYDITLKYHDLNGQQRISFRQRLTLKPVEDVFFSPPLLFYPNQSKQVSFPYGDFQPSSLQIHWDFNRDMGVFVQFWKADSSRNVSTYVEMINAETGKVLLRKDTVFTQPIHRESFSVIIPAELLQEGKHRLKVMHHFNDDSTRKIIPIDIIWFDKPISLWDLQLSIAPLQYIVDEATYKEINSGNDKERRRKLEAFWAKQDPTPETPFNELKKEFYSRVDSTLVRFSTRRKLGWTTDPGRIFILNGPPDKIDDHSLDPIPTPYMKWVYTQGDRQVVYVFRAVDGRKEYELIDEQESSL